MAWTIVVCFLGIVGVRYAFVLGVLRVCCVPEFRNSSWANSRPPIGWSGAGVGVGILRGTSRYKILTSKMCHYISRSQRFGAVDFSRCIKIPTIDLPNCPKFPRPSEIIQKGSNIFQKYLRFSGIYLGFKII